MNKEPIGLYIFRFILGLGLFAFMAMLYWSSVLIEEDVKFLRYDIAQLKNDLFSVRKEIDQARNDILKTTHFQQPCTEVQQPAPSQSQKPSSQTEDSQPNLLSADPFYEKTLPALLGKNFAPKGIRKEGSIGKPDNLHPFSNWSHVATWNGMCTVAISTQHFGIYETFAPEAARKMELRYNSKGQPEYWIHLRENLSWWPLLQEHFARDLTLAPAFLRKHPVTAHDFKFYFDAIMNPHVQEAQAVALRTYLGDIQEIEIVDDLTFIVRWKTEEIKDEKGKTKSQMKYMSKSLTAALRPLASFVYQYFPDGTKIISNDSDPNTYRTNPIWAQNFSQHWAKNTIVSCGPWLFDGITEREIRFRRNEDYFDPQAVLVEALEMKFKDSPDAVWEEFKSGSLDLFQVPPNQLAEADRFVKSDPYKKQAESGLAIKRLDFVDRSYNYIGWNQANPLFKSKKVRQALTMAIDRKRIIDRNLNGMGIEITGTFFVYSPSYDSTIQAYPFDLQKAKEMLEEEGWYDSNGDGIIDKVIDGKSVPFQFTLTYYVKNPTTKSICEYIATTLKEMGILCHLNGVDMADLSAAFDGKSFEAIYLGWSLGSPPEDPKQIWYSSGAKEKGSSNAVGFSNQETDKIIDQLQYEYNLEKRIELYHRFDAILYDEAPYTFLYTPKAAMLYREYLQNVFIPAERQDLIPDANVGEPQPNIFFLAD